MKRSQPKRDWTAAREKIEAENYSCRVCRREGTADPNGIGRIESAHIIGRERDRYAPGESRPLDELVGPDGVVVLPERIVPLCPRHHRAYDAHELDLLSFLDLDEQVQAVRDAGGIENARRRTAPSAYRGAS